MTVTASRQPEHDRDTPTAADGHLLGDVETAKHSSSYLLLELSVLYPEHQGLQIVPSVEK